MRGQLQRRVKPGTIPAIEDPAFRSRCISFAATGMSRRGVAAVIGKPVSTLLGWVERGMAYPGEEPYGSFSDAYRRAERGLEGAAVGTVALLVRRTFDLAQAGQWEKIDPKMVRDLLAVMEARFPEDWGANKHRVPEPEFDAQHWLDAHTMDHEQLAALFTDPPEPIRKALVSSADAVYGILLAGGFNPLKKESVT
jgi:hypothetical protein